MLLEEDILLRIQESDEEKRVKLQPEDMKLCVKKKSNRRQTVEKSYDINNKGEGIVAEVCLLTHNFLTNIG
jgi:hypothetical protein